MDSIQVKCTILKIEPVVEKETLKKQNLIVKTDEQYPQTYSIEFFKEKIELLEFVSEGSKVIVHCNLRGREWTNNEGVKKYFLSLNGWRIQNQ